jgi:hypothetical protein
VPFICPSILLLPPSFLTGSCVTTTPCCILTYDEHSAPPSARRDGGSSGKGVAPPVPQLTPAHTLEAPSPQKALSLTAPGGPGQGGSPALAGSRAQTAGTEERTLADWDLDEPAWRAPEAGHGKVRLSILPSPYLIPRLGPYLNPYLHCHGKVRNTRRDEEGPMAQRLSCCVPPLTPPR